MSDNLEERMIAVETHQKQFLTGVAVAGFFVVLVFGIFGFLFSSFGDKLETAEEHAKKAEGHATRAENAANDAQATAKAASETAEDVKGELNELSDQVGLVSAGELRMGIVSLSYLERKLVLLEVSTLTDGNLEFLTGPFAFATPLAETNLPIIIDFFEIADDRVLAQQTGDSIGTTMVGTTFGASGYEVRLHEVDRLGFSLKVRLEHISALNQVKKLKLGWIAGVEQN